MLLVICCFLIVPSGKKNLPASARDTGEAGSIPGSGRYTGEGHGNLLQYSYLDRRAWWATVHRIAKSQTQFKQLSMNAHSKC